MSLYIYHRVSSDAQDFAQQSNCIDGYLQSQRIHKSEIALSVTEKISGTVNHRDRKLSDLLAKCKQGDTIYFSELSRLGRNMNDLYNIVNECCERGIMLIQCKDGMKIENESIGGKALLFALSLAAEIEVKNIRQRTRMGLDARKKLLESDGAWMSNSGNVCTHFGREKGADLSAAREASALARANAVIAWREQSVAYAWVRTQLQKGKTRNTIIEEFNELHAQQPEVYCTREGKPLSKGVLSKWASQMNL